MKSNPVFRFRLISIFILLFSCFLVLRLFFLQVVRHDYYQNLAGRQYVQPAARLFDRGSIYFQTKDGNLVSAATIKQSYVLAVNPKLAPSGETLFSKLTPLVPTLEQAVVLAKTAKKDSSYQVLANRLDEQTVDRIRQLKDKSLILSREKWRYYPAGPLGSHVIGFMGYRGDDYIGRYGLEKEYEPILSRTDNQTFTNFFAEIFSGLNQKVTQAEPGGMGDIVLTIEPTVQNFLESTLTKVMATYRGEMAGGIIIDPKTGAIYAMATLPNFNPGEKQTELSILKNPSIENIYEMGSIVKALTMAAALDSGAVTAKTTYDDKGFIVLNKKKISNYDGKGRGIVSMQEVLNQSLNTGATYAMQRMGRETFRHYFFGYGLGEKTGIDLPNEASGLMNNITTNQDVNYATASFGQGISVSPIEITRALSVLANGGYLIKPYVVKEVKYPTLLKSVTKPVVGPAILKPATSQEITRMLTVVVDTKLANGKAKLPHTTVAAKTGTAQIVDPVTKAYYPDRYLHSFFGYFPAYNARFLVFLYIKHPHGVQYASETLTMPFLDITKFLLNYYNIPPDR